MVVVVLHCHFHTHHAVVEIHSQTNHCRTLRVAAVHVVGDVLHAERTRRFAIGIHTLGTGLDGIRERKDRRVVVPGRSSVVVEKEKNVPKDRPVGTIDGVLVIHAPKKPVIEKSDLPNSHSLESRVLVGAPFAVVGAWGLEKVGQPQVQPHRKMVSQVPLWELAEQRAVRQAEQVEQDSPIAQKDVDWGEQYG